MGVSKSVIAEFTKKSKPAGKADLRNRYGYALIAATMMSAICL